MSIWEMSPDVVQDENRLFDRMNRTPLLTTVGGTVRLIDRLASSGEPGAIAAITSALFSSSDVVHEAAVAGVNALLDLVPSVELIHLNGIFSGYRSYSSSKRWRGLKPKEVKSLLLGNNEVSVAGVLSLHGNGYVRQEAVKFLGGMTSGEELRFLLVRQNDWVRSVSEDAQALVKERLTNDNLKHFIRETDLLFHLLKCKRCDVSGLWENYVGLLIESGQADVIRLAMSSSGKKSGRRLTTDLLASEGGHLGRTVRVGLCSADAVVRTRCIGRSKDCLSKTECNQVADASMSDSIISVREEAYELKAKCSQEGYQVWRQCLLDKSRRLRETAMFYLKKSNCDVAGIYRDLLLNAPNNLQALSGLAACGDESDADTFQSYLDSPMPSRRCEAIRGIGRIGDDSQRLQLTPLLLDESSRVVRAAHRQLQSVAKIIEAAKIFDLLERCPTPAGKNAIFTLLLEKGHWPAMSYLIRGCSNGDPITAEIAKLSLKSMISRNKVFTRPTAEQRVRIQDAIFESKGLSANDFFRELSAYLSNFGVEFSD